MEVSDNLGVVYGLVVRSIGLVGGVAAGFKALKRGEVGQQTRLLEDSRRHALDRLVENARLIEADALVGVRFDSSEVGNGLTEILAYGTAVKLARARLTRGPTSGAADRRRSRAVVRAAVRPRRARAHRPARARAAGRADRRRRDPGAGRRGVRGPAGITTAGDPEPRQAPWFGGHGDADGPGPGWKPTGERFRDPRTKRVMRVWEDLSGQRHYVPDEYMQPNE